MDIKEEELEQIIWDASQTEEGRYLLSERGLDIEGTIYRQLKINPYGRADLITVDWFYIKPEEKAFDIIIYELKKEEINVNTLMQAARYVTGIKQYLKEERVFFKIYLIGTKLDKSSDFVFLYNILRDVEIYLCSYKIDGIYFEYQSKDWFKKGELDKETQALFEELKLNLLEDKQETNEEKE